MFLTLGLLVNPSELVHVAGIGLLVGIFMIVVARPATVFLCLLPFRHMTTRARWFVSWVGLRGAVPIIFATYPLIAGVEHANLIFNIVFFITIVSLLVQGTTVNYMAKILGLAVEEKEDAFPIDLPENIKSALSEIDVAPVLLEKGDCLRDLTLPKHTLVVMIKRDDRYFVPTGSTQLVLGDKLLVLSDNDEELKKTYESLGILNSIKS